NCSISYISNQFQTLITSSLWQDTVDFTTLLKPIYEQCRNFNTEYSSFRQQCGYSFLSLYNFTTIQHSPLLKVIESTRTSEYLTTIFQTPICFISLSNQFYMTYHNFFNSYAFDFNRHTIAIFFGNALPSFIVLIANLLSIKAIFFSKSLKYLTKSTKVNRGPRHSDIRAFIVILLESFSIIAISWGIPIALTMYNCHTLYVIDIDSCKQITRVLIVFLFIDLFNSSTNCLLYSLSGRLFRRNFLSLVKAIFTCGHSTCCYVKNDNPLTRIPFVPPNRHQNINHNNNNNNTTITNNNNDNNNINTNNNNNHMDHISIVTNLNHADFTLLTKRQQLRKPSDCPSLLGMKESGTSREENYSSSNIESDRDDKSQDYQTSRKLSTDYLKYYIVNKVRTLKQRSSHKSNYEILFYFHLYPLLIKVLPDGVMQLAEIVYLN
ncbi:unnamed protein product, partial [Didymodactylos carnosus]